MRRAHAQYTAGRFFSCVFTWRKSVYLLVLVSLPVACQAVPACSPPPCHTHPPGCYPGTGSMSVDTPGTHSPSDDTNQTDH